ncbi:hypothetical protein SLEP1_g40994 [Rubroshorea leprosula]|uniref:Uncharacterized protein n=1 Tax=Rubroshorea leprosula TaxID=152421 RepID=A0AAV5L545_9ROSI|nr:hypothetical protein SLEP1_g40994 [Rubroshorea leprosula]
MRLRNKEGVIMKEPSSRRAMTKPGALAAYSTTLHFFRWPLRLFSSVWALINKMQQKPCIDGKVNDAAAACYPESSANEHAADPLTNNRQIHQQTLKLILLPLRPQYAFFLLL